MPFSTFCVLATKLIVFQLGSLALSGGNIVIRTAVDHHPLDLRAAHPNVPERAVIERMKLAYRRDACASDGVGAPPFAGRRDGRTGKGADDGQGRGCWPQQPARGA